jgi:hypothetical protein
VIPRSLLNKDLLLSIGLLLVCYGGFMWLTADDHRAAIRVESIGTVATVEHEARTRLAALPAAHPTDSISEDETEPREVELQSEIESDPAAEDEITFSVRAEIPEIVEQRVYPPESYTVQSLGKIVQQNTDRDTRIAAVNTLLLIGRKSMIDPAVIAALKEATKVSDSAVSALATSALAEVERETH